MPVYLIDCVALFHAVKIDLMEEAKKKGFEADMLAELADGSTDSFEYLRALAGAKDVDALNKLYREARESAAR